MGALHRQAEFSELLIDSSVDGIVAFDRDCRFTIWNSAMERGSGYTGPQTLGRSAFELFPFLRETGDDRLFLEALAGRTAVVRDRPYVARTGRRGFFEGHVTPLVDERGAVVGGLAILRDRTEQRQLEEQQLRSRKMEAVGRFAGGVAHEFSNMLTVISGRAELLLMATGRSDPRHEHAEEILRATEKATSLIRHLSSFRRRQVLRETMLDVNGVAADMDPLLRRLIGGRAQLSFDLAPDLAPVRADPLQVEQLILNLVTNSRDAMPEGGRIVLRTANLVLSEEEARRHGDVEPGRHAVIEVSDTGVGMDAATLERIFEPFFTTKPHGTGLGLSTVYGIVQQSAGHVVVESRPGLGSTFRVYLPQA